MPERAMMLESACAAMMAGDAIGCDNALNKFRESVRRRALDDAEKPSCTQQLERLQSLAAAARDGIATARDWLAELVQATGGLEIYDRGGRHRVPTEISGAPRRF